MDTDTPYTHDELPLIETAEPVSSFVLIHLRRSPFFLALPVLSRKRTFLRSKLAFRGDDYCLNRTLKYLHKLSIQTFRKQFLEWIKCNLLEF